MQFFLPNRTHLGRTLSILVLVVMVGSGLGASASLPPQVSHLSVQNDAAGSSVTGILGLGAALGNLTPEFWAVNYNYMTGANGYDNLTVTSLLNETPVTWIRFPLVDTSYQEAATWQALAQFCDSVPCHSIATVGGPGITPQDAANDVKRAEGLGIHPDFWVLGNEPNLWPGETSIEYANLVYAWIQLVHASDPSARFLGAEISGNPRVGSDYIYNVTKVDGPYVQGLAIQVYPQVGGSTLPDFLAALTAGASVQNAILNARTLMASACLSCSIPLLLNEVNGGSGFNTNYIPFREQFPDATFLAASIIQGLRLGLQQFAPWTLTGASSTPASGTNHCDFGMIQLLPGCDGEYLQPTFSLYQNLLSQLPFGALTNVTFPGAPDFYGIQSTNGSHRALLVVNADATVTENFTLGSGFPVGAAVLSYLMDPNHVASPLATAADSGSVFSLPPTGVMLLEISSAPEVGITATPAELALGNSTQVQAVVTGAAGTLTYAYPELPSGCSSANVSDLNCTPDTVGSFPITVLVTEGTQTIGTSQADLTVTSSEVTSTPTFYPVTFGEVGLPTGTPWTVEMNGTFLNTTNGTEVTTLLNGTYPYSIGTPAEFFADPPAGEFNVSGIPQLVVIGFSGSSTPPPPPPSGGSNNSTNSTPTSFAVTFQAAGLAAHSDWTLTLDGVGYGVGAVNVTVTLGLGAHSFTVNASGYEATPSAGVVAMKGASYQEAIDFTPLVQGITAPDSPPASNGLWSFFESPILLGLLATMTIGSWGVPYARHKVRRCGYARWFQEEKLLAAENRRADVASELSRVPLRLDQWAVLAQAS
jgi:hypothetical protein